MLYLYPRYTTIIETQVFLHKVRRLLYFILYWISFISIACFIKISNTISDFQNILSRILNVFSLRVDEFAESKSELLLNPICYFKILDIKILRFSLLYWFITVRRSFGLLYKNKSGFSLTACMLTFGIYLTGTSIIYF